MEEFPRDPKASRILPTNTCSAIAPSVAIPVFAYFGYFLIRYFGTMHTASCCHGSRDRG